MLRLFSLGILLFAPLCCRAATEPEDLDKAIGAFERAMQHMKSPTDSPELFRRVADLLQRLMRQKEHRAAAFRLLRGAWQAFPHERCSLLYYACDDDVWNTPEVTALVREYFQPTDAAIRRDPWWGVHAQGYSVDGRLGGPVSYMFGAQGDAKRREELRGDIAAGVQRNSDWRGGRALLAIFDVTQGKVEQGKAALAALLKDPSAGSMPRDMCRAIAQELESREELCDTAIALYEASLKDSENRLEDYLLSARPRLAQLYLTASRPADARALLLAATRPSATHSSHPAAVAYQRIYPLAEISRTLLAMNFPVDALRVYREIVVLANSPEIQAFGYRESMNYMLGQAEEQRTKCLAIITSDRLATAIGELLSPAPDGGQPVIDLMTVVASRQVGRLRMESLLLDLLASDRMTDEGHKGVDQQLQQLAEKNAQDLSVRIAAAVHAFRGADDRAKAAVQSLVQLVQAEPLPNVTAKPPTARERNEVEVQVVLWLVARLCASRPGMEEAARLLGDRAVAAARLEPSKSYLLAILDERAESALQAGDRARAERTFGEMVDVVAARPVASPQSPAARIPPGTWWQRHAALAIAETTASDFPRPSARAVSVALKDGPPAADGAPSEAAPLDEVPFSDWARDQWEVAPLLARLVRQWEHGGLPPVEIYDTLAATVFPQARPEAIYLYQRWFQATEMDWPISAGRLLAAAALRADRGGDLRTRIAARSQQPASQLAGRVLLIHLALEGRDAPTAAKHLATLAEQLRSDAPVGQVACAAHAAIHAARLGGEPLAAAMPIAERVTKTFAPQLQAWEFSLLIGRALLREGNAAAARTRLDEYLSEHLALYARSGHSSSKIIQRDDLLYVASHAARYHHVPLMLEYLGQLADLPPIPGDLLEVTVPLWHLARHTASLPAADRYRLLHDWTMPAGQRRAVRCLAGFNPGQPIPDSIVRSSLGPLGPDANLRTPRWLADDFAAISNLTLLVDAAKEAQALSGLTAEAAQANAVHAAQADLLLVLCLVAGGEREEGERLIQTAAADMKRRHAGNPSDVHNRPDWRDYLLVQACLRSPQFADLGREMAAAALYFAQQRPTNVFLTHLGHEMALDDSRPASAEQRAAVRNCGLKLWIPDTGPLVSGPDSPPAWWAAHEGFVVHRTGIENDRLYFRYPLTGEFTFSVQSSLAHYGSGEIGYAGLICEPQSWARQLAIYPDARHDWLTLPGAVETMASPGRRMTLAVTKRSVRFLVNDHLAFEERNPTPASPWLKLACFHHRQVAYRNARLLGQPVIPREVALTHGDRLEGWHAELGGRLPRRLTAETSPQPDEPRGPDWCSREGVLCGPFRPDYNAQPQSLLSYYRPLQPREAVHYEFLYEPDKTHVHPALGRVAFLLEPSGVRLHWIEWQNDRSALYATDPAHAVDEPQHARGPRPLPLQPGRWNRVEVALEGDMCRVRLNGQLVCERPMEPTNTRKFGLFHFRNRTDAEVRNVVLRGDWPQALSAEEMADLFAADSPTLPAAVQSARHALVGERYLTQFPEEICEAAARQPLESRYRSLRDWVVPGPTHPTFRLQATFTVLDPPPVAHAARVRTSAAAPHPHVYPAHRGGRLIAPALDLVAAAAELKRLDELAELVGHTAAPTLHDQRSRAALGTLIAIAQGDDDAARRGLTQMLALLQTLPPNTPEHERYPEAVVLAESIGRPKLSLPSLTLAHLLVEQQQATYVSNPWEKMVRHLRGKARWTGDSVTAAIPWATPPAMTQWSPVDFPTAESRASGVGPSAWRFARGEVEHYPGNAQDGLYFTVPLRGNFEVQYEQSTYGWREIFVGYGTVAVGPLYDGKSVDRHALGRASQRIALHKPIDRWGSWVTARLVVQDGRYTAFLNGRQVHQENLPNPCDPWLFIRTAYGHYHGMIRNLRILGEPQVPRELPLSSATDLAGWHSSYFDETIDSADSRWGKQGDEIVGRPMENTTGSSRESLLQYHRPLLEDGTVSYEFFYQPGKIEVHPAVDRLVWLVRPGGVRGHWLTDGALERGTTTLRPNNEFVAEDTPAPTGKAAASPLLVGAWNRAQLAVHGDEVTLAVNGCEVVRRRLEANNQRIFGLFFYCDATAARVRNVVYRGAWPRRLPSLAAQELAASPDDATR